jgi:hypothetical protein
MGMKYPVCVPMNGRLLVNDPTQTQGFYFLNAQAQAHRFKAQ